MANNDEQPLLSDDEEEEGTAASLVRQVTQNVESNPSSHRASSAEDGCGACLCSV